MSTDEYRIRIAKGLCRTWPESPTRVIVAEEIRLHGGDRVAIMGPSGSGKTTLLRMLGALDRPSNGEIEYRLPKRHQSIIWADKNRSSCNASMETLRSIFGFVFQDARLIPYFTVLENILSIPLSRGAAHEDLIERTKKVQLLMREIRLGTTTYSSKKNPFKHRNLFLARISRTMDRQNNGRFLERYPKNLSGGEKRRIALLRALLADPLVLFADEPTSGVDTETGAIVMCKLTEWARKEDRERLLIFVTHSPEETRFYANRWLSFSYAKTGSHHYRLEETRDPSVLLSRHPKGAS
uniref:Putative ABC transport system ATP-binding protein n=1 Tax=Candidatus Kentrum sp. LFY TaxID=2126342 RepID=A0A450UUG5_9GAMM|nr:MAG: putative ABC transport system ATP-binding protein [Candidatus Kentron sp. LFY]